MKGVKEKVFHAWKTGTFPSPATKTLGIKTLELSEGRSLVEMMVDQNHHNMSATMHGGIMADIADAAMGIAIATTVSPEEDFTTIDRKSTRLNSSHTVISYAVFCLKKKKH